MWKPEILDERNAADRTILERLRSDSTIDVLDERAAQRDALREVIPRPTELELTEPDRWIHYPWRRTLVAVLGPENFRRLRLDRNRNKLTSEEQRRLGQLTIGVIGLSVGHAVAHTLALEGICGRLKLADFDEVELSNLNRIPASLLDLGVNKAVVAARRISEIDPYLHVEVFTEGIQDATMDAFFDGLDIVVEECDSLDVKVRVREAAREKRIPLIMETSDRGLLDIERYDLDPGLGLFHGLLGDIDSRSLAGLSTKDKVPFVLAQLDAAQLSARIAASMIEIDETISTWPQLGSEVTLGAASVTAAVRRLGLGGDLPSGRVRIDLDAQLDAITKPVVRHPRTNSAVIVSPPTTTYEAIAHAVDRAPSGGNSQPWTTSIEPTKLTLRIDELRTSTLDVAHRGSYVALGAALFNGRVAAAAEGMLGSYSIEDGYATIDLNSHRDSENLASLNEAMLARATNRNFGAPSPLTDSQKKILQDSVSAEGASLRLLTEEEHIAKTSTIFAESDRIRYVTEDLRNDMLSELRWPGDPDSDFGIEVHSLGMEAGDLVKLDIVKRDDVMSLISSWDGGRALGRDIVDRLNSTSALAVVLIPDGSSHSYIRGGSAVERMWIEAQKSGLTVQPVSPVFLYAHTADDLRELSPTHYAQLGELRTEFTRIVGPNPDERIALVLRLSHSLQTPPISRRRPR